LASSRETRHETSTPSISASGRGHCHVPSRIADRKGGKLPVQAGALHHRIYARRLGRHSCTTDGSMAFRTAGRTICGALGVGKAFVRKCRNKFDSGGADVLFARQSKSNRKIDNEKLLSAVFSLLHEPPANHGINRTSWTMPLLSQVLKKNGTQVGPALISRMIKAAVGRISSMWGTTQFESLRLACSCHLDAHGKAVAPAAQHTNRVRWPITYYYSMANPF
jgi:hypothetical protein